jgi:hypothetical protein
MKNFQELTKKELANLTEQQIDAYIDVTLANEGIIKPIKVQIDYPEYIRNTDVFPERDITYYEVEDKAFVDLETAQKYASFLGGLIQLVIDYEYYPGRDTVYYVKGQKQYTPEIQIKKIYSQAKYEACKTQISAINSEKKKEIKENEESSEAIINYDAIDKVKYEIRDKIRKAILFFEEVKEVISDYQKYFSITNDKQVALTTLYTVYDIQDSEMKEEIEKGIIEEDQEVVPEKMP